MNAIASDRLPSAFSRQFFATCKHNDWMEFPTIHLPPNRRPPKPKWKWRRWTMKLRQQLPYLQGSSAQHSYSEVISFPHWQFSSSIALGRVGVAVAAQPWSANDQKLLPLTATLHPIPTPTPCPCRSRTIMVIDPYRCPRQHHHLHHIRHLA